MTWRQDHIIPEPYLVITGMSYLMPAWLAWKSGFYYSLASNLFLCATTMSFHWFRTQWLFELDVVAVLNYVLCCSLNGYYAGPSAMGVWVFSASYGVYSYFVGQQLSILSWDPDWNTQMFFHGLMHLSSAYGAWYVLTKRNELLLTS
jgi:hypothetical protein